jgi:putative transposase
MPSVSMERKAVGIDVGLLDLAVTSDGSKFANPRHLKAAERNLERKLARKVKGSNRRARARRLVARAHQRVTDARRDHLHKLSRRLVDENQVVIVEEPHVRGMVKNPTLAKAISDAGWGKLIRFIEYKCGREGKAFVRTNRRFPSSKACSAFRHVRDTMGLDVRHWTCSHCGASHDRDVNAARNTRDEGLRLLAVGTTAAASRETISRRKKLASRSARPNEAGISSR